MAGIGRITDLSGSLETLDAPRGEGREDAGTMAAIDRRMSCPPPPSASEIDEVKKALCKRYVALAPRRIEALREALGRAADDPSARRDLQRLGHQLRGTAPTVGLRDLGLLGGFVESLAATTPFAVETSRRAEGILALIEECFARARDGVEHPPIWADPRLGALMPERR